MQIDKAEQNGWQIMRLEGRLDGGGAPLLERAIDAFLDEGGRHLVLDLTRLNYVSSIGLRVLLMAGKRLVQPATRKGVAIPAKDAEKGKLVLSGLQANVRDVLEMSGFIALFPVVDDLAMLQPVSS